MTVLIIVLIAIVIFLLIKCNFKKWRYDCISMVVGAPKTGKTTLQVYLGIKDHKKRVTRWKIKNFFRKLFKKQILERPLLYSNIPLKVDYVPIEKDLLERKKRFRYDSTVILSETSLIADSMSAVKQSQDINTDLNLFYKLIGHELHGGAVFVETQNPSDNHYALKRCLNRYLFIQRTIKVIPFIIVFKVVECMYLDGVDGVSTQLNGDLEENTKLLIVWKSIWRKFDYCSLSTFTDNKPIADKVIKGQKDLKTKKVVSYNPIVEQKLDIEKEQKNNEQQIVS